MATLGQERVGVTFNPSNDPRVDAFKEHTAYAIDELETLKGGATPEVARCASIAQTKFEEAAMWAVKAITKPSSPVGSNDE